MSVENISIEFDRIYFEAGGQLTGKFNFEITKQIHLVSVNLAFKGVGEIRLVCNNGKIYKETQTFFKEKLLMFENVKTDKTPVPIGSHTCQFSLPLSSDLPGSFEGECGRINYRCKAIFRRQRPLKPIFSQKFNFIIVESQLNRQPIETERKFSKSLSYFEREKGFVEITLRLSQSLFLVPEETISGELQLQNLSNSEINSVDLSLMELRIYRGKKRQITCRSQLSSKTIANYIKADNNVETFQVDLDIPIHTAEPTKNFPLITVSHYLVLAVIPQSGCNAHFIYPVSLTKINRTDNLLPLSN